jgi:hypothetical protein
MPGHDDHDLERGLRAQRPEARDEFVQNIAAAVRSRRQSSPRPRLGLSVALSLAILVSLVAFGGVGAASSALHSSAAAVRSAVGDGNGKGRDVEQGKPSHDQYHSKAFVCLPKHHKHHKHHKALAYVTRRVSDRSVPSLVSKGAIYPVPAGGCSSLNGQATDNTGVTPTG